MFTRRLAVNPGASGDSKLRLGGLKATVDPGFDEDVRGPHSDWMIGTAISNIFFR